MVFRPRVNPLWKRFRVFLLIRNEQNVFSYTPRKSKSGGGPVDDAEMIVGGQVEGPSKIPEVETMDGIRPSERDENTRSVSEQLTTLLEIAGK